MSTASNLYKPFLPFTVILKRPVFLSQFFDNDPATDIYVATVKAESAERALVVARLEVLKADLKEFKDLDDSEGKAPAIKAKDYVTLVILDGHPRVIAHGCATGWWS